MTLVFKINGSTLPDEAVLRDTITGFPSSAWYGEPMTAGLQIDDPGADYDLTGWSVFTVDETDCIDNERIFTGWITGKRISRGAYRSGPSRIWDCDIIDQNACLSFQPFRAKSAQRPAETDLERVTFCLGSGPMSNTPVVAGPLTNLTDNPIALQDSNFVTQYPVELLQSSATPAGKMFYVFWNDADAELQLFYDQADAFPASSIAISNVIADVDDDTVFYPFIDAELERSPESLYTGELLGYRGGYVFVERQATIDDLSPTPLSPSEFRRENVRTTDRIGHASTATSVATADVDGFATEVDTITVTLRLPSSHVNFVEAGQTIPAKFTHLPGYEAGPDTRVIRRNVVIADVAEAVYYDVRLELSNQLKVRDIDGGPPGVFPHQPCVPQLVQVQEGHVSSGTTPATWDPIPTPGNLLVMWVNMKGNAAGQEFSPDGWTPLDTGWAYDPSGTKDIGCRMFYKLAGSPETATPTYTQVGSPNPYVCMVEFTTVDTLDDFLHLDDTTNQNSPSPMFFGAGPVTPSASRPCLFIGGVMPSLNTNDNPWNPFDTTIGGTTITIAGKSTTTGSGVGGSDGKAWFGYKVGSGTPSPVAEIFALESLPNAGASRGHVGLMAAFTGDPCTNDCPDTGQWVRDVLVGTGDGTTTNFFTACPYADGSLSVSVDNLPILAGLTEVDGATGEFSLDFAPKDAEGDAPAEQVYASYQGR